MAMGGVDQLDSSVANYRIKIKSKKWWWCHFKNSVPILLVAAWNVWRHVNSDEKYHSELSFIIFIFSRYSKLPNDKVIQSVKTSTRVSDAVRLNQQFYGLLQVHSQRRCAIPSCKSRVRTICKTCVVTLCP